MKEQTYHNQKQDPAVPWMIIYTALAFGVQIVAVWLYAL